MRDLHPRFRFHTGDWLVRHLVIKHCQSRSRFFAKVGDDPDLKIYEQYMIKQKQQKQKEAQQAIKRRHERHIEPRKRAVLRGPKVSGYSLFSIC